MHSPRHAIGPQCILKELKLLRFLCIHLAATACFFCFVAAISECPIKPQFGPQKSRESGAAMWPHSKPSPQARKGRVFRIKIKRVICAELRLVTFARYHCT